MRTDGIEYPLKQASKQTSPGAQAGSEDKEASAFDQATTANFSAYVFDQTKVFLRAAQDRELNFLTYLLEMVAIEAARLRDEK